MEYSDNPRKVYGKVDIVYADEELSRDVKVAVSGNSEISHPDEVFHLPSEPTIKACTMDGNATMVGTFQMMGKDLIVGWWSEKCADGSGKYASKPYIEISFMMRPVIYWRVIGDTKLNQYPVDFTLQYKKNGTIVKTETIKGNTEVEIVTAPKVEDITSVRMTIEKWSAPNAVAKILRFFERVYESYEGDSLLSFEVGEELCSSEGNYNINSDSMTVSIYNEDRKFDKGYLRTLMLLDRKLYPYIGIEKDGEIEYKPLGVFYSDEWDIPQDSQWVKCTATDRMMRLQAKTYIGFPLIENVSLYEIAEDILTKMGLSAAEYQITNRLKDFVVDTALLPKTTGWDALQEIANAGLCKIFVDRENRIVIKCEDETPQRTQTEVNPGNMFSYKSNITLTDFSNSVSVDYCEISIKDDLIEVAEPEIRLEPYEMKTITIDYTSEVAYPSASSDNASVRITSFESGVNSCICVLKNNVNAAQTAVITVSGNAIDINTRTVTVRNEESILLYGIVEYKHPTSELVQSYEQAEYMATLLISRMRAGEGSITAVWRGNPELEVGLAYDCVDRFGDKQSLLCEYNKFTYDGGLKQETRGRKL
ncbi:MAG: hypothetical protein NC311_11880 [Muribaculaceae bacterium]|nr:hypothetical protein [Muribaculaceae bacterium]